MGAYSALMASLTSVALIYFKAQSDVAIKIGTTDCRKAVETNKRCETLYRMGEKNPEYLQCKKEMEDLVHKLVTLNYIVLENCKLTPVDTVECSLMVHFKTYFVTVTNDLIVAYIRALYTPKKIDTKEIMVDLDGEDTPAIMTITRMAEPSDEEDVPKN